MTVTAATALLVGGASLSPAASTGASAGQVRQQLSAGRQRISVLAGTVARARQRAGELGTGVTALESRVAALQRDLNPRRAQLLSLRAELGAAQHRLGRRQAAERAAERELADELVGNYEGDRPNLMSVVVESTGFDDLLEQLAFAEQVAQQDARILAQVRSARRAVATEALSLGRLTALAQRVADQVLAERDQVAAVRLALATRQLAAARVKAVAAGRLTSAQSRVDALTQQLQKLRTPRAALPLRGTPAPSAPQPGAATGSGGASAGAVAPTDEIPFPMPRAQAAPPATWSLGEGIGIAAPAGTPEVAVCDGTIVLHGIGGLGPSAPVLRCSRPLSGHDFVYYGFAGPDKLALIGADVTRGQTIARIGWGVIGASTGPHLEIGFADASGSPLGSAAATMMTLLRAAYAR